MILVDDRERRSGICEELNRFRLPYEITRLRVGDYIINNSVFIERKTTNDFIASLNDKRLFIQASCLRRGGHRALMIIEGEHLPNRASIRGALCSLTVKFYLPVIRSRIKTETVEFMKYIYNYENKTLSNKVFCTFDFRCKRRETTLQERMLLQLRHIGPTASASLLSKFGSIGKILNATKEELLSVKGVGKLIAEEIDKLR